MRYSMILMMAVMAAAAPVAAAETRQGPECRYRPSFNCALAEDAASRTICSEIGLMRADCAMGYAYRDARAQPGANPNGSVQKNQRAWVRQRDAACAAPPRSGQPDPALAGCLRDQTERRLRWLIGHYKLPVAGKVYEPFAGTAKTD